MPTFSIRLRLALTVLVILGVSGTIQVVGYAVERSRVASLYSGAVEIVALEGAARGLHDAIDRQHSYATEYLFDGSLDALAGYQAARAREAEVSGASAAIIAKFPEVDGEFQVLRAAMESWRTGFLDPTIAMIASDRVVQSRLLRNAEADKVAYEPVVVARDRLDHHVAVLNDASLAAMERMGGDPATSFLIGVIWLLIGTIVFIWQGNRWLGRPLGRLVAAVHLVEAGEDVRFPTDRDDEIGELGRALEQMRAGLAGQADEASVVNRFTEFTAFVEADGDVARATLDALDELVEPDDGSIHISNRSKDRALPEGSLGDVVPQVISLGHMSNCPGVRRGGTYVSGDLGERLSVRCPAYGATDGTLACIPLVALGDVVGVVHLHWQARQALPLDIRGAVTRIAEHASLEIANRRLMVALQGMASTDGRTGLPNSRTFDEALQLRLATRDPGSPLSVLMIDIDHFKAFNDRNGHPAGDQALRTFSRVLQASVRDGDLAARYGGEEFVVMLPDASETDAAVVAERIRAEVEATPIDLSPGHRDQVTVSIGVATWPMDADDRVELLEVADAALYRAKNTGRNRVVPASREFSERAAPNAAPGPEPAHAMPEPVVLPRAS